MRVASRAQMATESPTLALTAKTNALKKAGEPVIGFGAGEPDFDKPEHIKEAAIQAIRDGFTKYCPTAGTLSLREAIVAKIARDQGLQYQPNQVCVSVGGKHSLHQIFETLLDPGDAVFLPAPYWVSYVDQIRLAGGVPLLLPTTEATGLKVTPAQLAEALELYPFAKALVLNSPSNPTGATYDEAEMAALAAVLEQAPELTIISDEIYEHLIYGGRRHVSIAEQEALRDRVILCNGVSKAYSMTGWRCGWAVGPKPFIEAMVRVQSHDSSGTCSITQAAAEAALRGDQSCVETMRQAFEQRLRVMIDGLNALPGVSCSEPGGAFYAFPNITAHLAPGETASAFADRLLVEAKVAVVPGEGFGAPGNVRLSYAASMADIEEGLARIAEFLK
ncbi:MAG: pyridoxal phosphate-dependent aminotransferase [Fimbriimonadaceae bacterium]|nr:pyridoxal phosphate-dependent aminotransferase [Fimbriimonadaceae bacterium]